MTASADTVAAHLQALSALPHYIRKLERKQAASEKSMRMKSKRIAELEEEVRRLVSSQFLILAKWNNRVHVTDLGPQSYSRECEPQAIESF